MADRRERTGARESKSICLTIAEDWTPWQEDNENHRLGGSPDEKSILKSILS